MNGSNHSAFESEYIAYANHLKMVNFPRLKQSSRMAVGT